MYIPDLAVLFGKLIGCILTTERQYCSLYEGVPENN